MRIGLSKFRHYLFTRFNLNLPPTSLRKPTPMRSIEKGNAVRHYRQWLDMRMRYFRKYCLPSVLAQTNNNFQWIIFIHEKTPDKLVRELAEYAQIVPTEFCDYEVAQEVLRFRPESKYVITTNLDSDDAISKDYIATVQNNFQSKVEYLNIPTGYNLRDYENNPKKEYVGKHKLQNPFRSFVERGINPLTVYYVTHGLSSTIAPVRQIEDSKAAWLQVIHGDNLANRFRQYKDDKPEDFSNISHLFGIK